MLYDLRVLARGLVKLAGAVRDAGSVFAMGYHISKAGVPTRQKKVELYHGQKYLLKDMLTLHGTLWVRNKMKVWFFVLLQSSVVMPHLLIQF